MTTAGGAGSGPGARPAKLPATLEARYGGLERLLHRLAFAALPLQKSLAELEDRLYARRAAGVKVSRPVFIASLPRAGTTLLLETIAALPGFAAHTYRNMPFLLIPLLWDTLSRRFHAAGGKVERAQGDGVSIGFDSPEAFEEVLWRAFHPAQYGADRILPWSADAGFDCAEFDAFMQEHIRKLATLRVGAGAARYLSKNNGNLSRLGKLARLFPDAAILIPFRNPVDHAASLLRQHLVFERLHANEPFTRRYMADLGHYDFGANLRPIDFDHWLDEASLEPPNAANFWLRYWQAAFSHILANLNDQTALVSYDGLCAAPAAGLRRIAQRLGVEDGAELMAAARFRSPARYDAGPLNLNRALLESAQVLHRELLSAAIVA